MHLMPLATCLRTEGYIHVGAATAFTSSWEETRPSGMVLGLWATNVTITPTLQTFPFT